MNCPRCSAPQPDDAAFCNKCGGSLSAKPAAAPAANPLQPPSGTRPPDNPEQDVWEGRMSGKALAHLWALWILWAGILTYVYFGIEYVQTHAWAGYTVLILAVLPLPYILFKLAYGKLAIKYRLSTHRFFKSVGILSRKINELELIRVDDVSVEQNIFQRLFDVGVITIMSTDTTDPRLIVYGVDSPIALKEKIREHVRKRRERSLFVESL